MKGSLSTLLRINMMVWVIALTSLATGCDLVLYGDAPPDVSCPIGAKSCNGAEVMVCEDGHGFRTKEVCADHEVCSAGACQTVSKIAAGGATTCTVLSDGAVLCWGNNAQGQCGQSGVELPDLAGEADLVPPKVQLEPARVHFPDTSTGQPVAVTSVAVGGDDESGHACALTEEGDVWCWGDNRSCQSSPSDVCDGWVPPSVVSFDRPKEPKLRVGFGRTCVWGETAHGRDELTCWGKNDQGQIDPALWAGHGVVKTPQHLLLLAEDTEAGYKIDDLALGAAHTCALLRREAVTKVVCWGAPAALCCQGSGGPAGPLEVVLGAGAATAIAAGDSHTCALTDAGVYCWGKGICEETGQSTCDAAAEIGIQAVLKQPAIGSEKPHAIAAGGLRTCVTRSLGVVHCWEAGAGAGAEAAFSVDLGSRPAAVTLGHAHVCASFPNRADVQCWGENALGQLARPGGADEEPAPVKWYAETVTPQYP